MGIQDWEMYKFYKRNEMTIQGIQGLCIILLLSMVWYNVYQEVLLKQQISQTCGWGEEDYYCYCEHSLAMELKNKLQDLDTKLNVSDITEYVPFHR